MSGSCIKVTYVWNLSGIWGFSGGKEPVMKI